MTSGAWRCPNCLETKGFRLVTDDVFRCNACNVQVDFPESPSDPWTAGRAAWSIERPSANLGAALDLLDEYEDRNGFPVDASQRRRVEAIVRVVFVMPEPTPEAVEAFEAASERAGVRLKRVR